jgi:hypothetical protein
MAILRWKLALKGTSGAGPRGSRRAERAGRNRFRPMLDPMEDRTLLSITVTNPGDSGPGTLRQAILNASDGDTINFAPSLTGARFAAIIGLTSGELTINKSLDIEGLGPNHLVISGLGTSRIFDVTTPGVKVTIAGLTITNSMAPLGGGILNQGGQLTVSTALSQKLTVVRGASCLR